MAKLSDQTKWKIINAIGFQTVWFACVMGRSDWVLIPLLLIVLHVVFVDRRRQEMIVLLVAAAVGICVDSTLAVMGLYEFNREDLLLGVIPLWLVVLWVGLGGTLRHSFDYLFKRPIAFPLLCGLVAPISYFGGERIGAVNLQWQPLDAYVAMAVAWTIAALMLQWLFKLLNNRLRLARSD